MVEAAVEYFRRVGAATDFLKEATAHIHGLRFLDFWERPIASDAREVLLDLARAFEAHVAVMSPLPEAAPLERIFAVCIRRYNDALRDHLRKVQETSSFIAEQVALERADEEASIAALDSLGDEEIAEAEPWSRPN